MARADRSEQLLVTAEQVFAERGYRATSMEDIAERAGVTKPVLYDHFGSKDGLLAAVVARSGTAIRDVTQAAIATADGPADALQRGLRAYFQFVEEHATAWSVVLTEVEATSAAAEQLEIVRHGIAEFVAGLIAAELPDGDLTRARLYAQAVVGATERLALHARSDSTLTPETLTAALMDVAWMGLHAVNAGKRWQ
jgi:AcrR family transcriptional regulator